MGRPKAELKRIHAKRRRKTKEQIKKHLKGEISHNKLTQFAKKTLKKRKKREKTPA